MIKYDDLPILESEHIIMRKILSEDTDKIIFWRNLPDIKKKFLFRENFTKEMHEHWLKEKVLTGQVIQYVMKIKRTGKRIGSIYYRDVNYVSRTAEFGVFIGDCSEHGKGFGTEAINTFIKFGIEQLQLKQIYLRVLKDNWQARRVYEKIGFVENENISKQDNNNAKVLWMLYEDSGSVYRA